MPTERLRSGNGGGGAEADRTSAEGRRRTETWWMISRDDARGGVEPLTLNRDGVEALALFGFAEEAALYLRLEGLGGDGWRVRASASGEVVSVLSGPCAGVGRVALDPIPETADGVMGLAYVERRRFLARLLGAEASDRRPTGPPGSGG